MVRFYAKEIQSNQMNKQKYIMNDYPEFSWL